MQREPLDAARVRKLPSHFAWADHRVREHFPTLTLEEIALYFFLHLAADRFGMSFYADSTLSRLLGLSEGQVARAREGLGAKGLITYRYPVYQLLEVPCPKRS
jgi:hypothetical protein